jgi:hypothetical protein
MAAPRFTEWTIPIGSGTRLLARELLLDGTPRQQACHQALCLGLLAIPGYLADTVSRDWRAERFRR